MQLSGALGEHLLCPEVSGIKAPQATAMCGILRIIGMQRLKVTAPSEAPVKQTYVVETLVRCEIHLPLFTCTMVRHLLLHFYAEGGWADDLGVAPGISK